MRYSFPYDTDFRKIILTPEDRGCEFCNQPTIICDHRRHDIFTLVQPTSLVCRLTKCKIPSCPGHHKTVSPMEELNFTMPYWLIGWDVFAFIGLQRFGQHRSVPQILNQLQDTYKIYISHDSIEKHSRFYQNIVAARQSDFQLLQNEYKNSSGIILSIDGLQPEKGHETLYVVREVTQKRVWFAEPLISSTYEEVKKLLIKAKAWVDTLNLPVKLWVSDKQDAFVKGIADVFSGTPHKYCENHFMRNVAKPVIEADSACKVKIRKHVRGLRKVEKSMLESISEQKIVIEQGKKTEFCEDAVIGYCTAIRGVLNSDQGGPLNPSSIKMTDGLQAIRKSLEKCEKIQDISKSKGEVVIQNSEVIEKGVKQLISLITEGLEKVEKQQEEIIEGVSDIHQINNTLDPDLGSTAKRKEKFEKLTQEFRESDNETRKLMARVMESFKPGLFVGEGIFQETRDNQALERFFKTPKGHERKIHGRQHAGKRIVIEGPTLLPTLNAHESRKDPFNASDLLPYSDKPVPISQQEAVERNKAMRKVASKTKRPAVLQRLEKLFDQYF